MNEDQTKEISYKEINKENKKTENILDITNKIDEEIKNINKNNPSIEKILNLYSEISEQNNSWEHNDILIKYWIKIENIINKNKFNGQINLSEKIDYHEYNTIEDLNLIYEYIKNINTVEWSKRSIKKDTTNNIIKLNWYNISIWIQDTNRLTNIILYDKNNKSLSYTPLIGWELQDLIYKSDKSELYQRLINEYKLNLKNIELWNKSETIKLENYNNVYHIPIFSEHIDWVVSPIITSIIQRRKIIQSKNQNTSLLNPIITNGKIDHIIEQIQKNSIKDEKENILFIELPIHWSKEKLLYKNELNGYDFFDEICKIYQNINIVIMTPACYQWWMIKNLERYLEKNPQNWNRITLITQSKWYIPNSVPWKLKVPRFEYKFNQQLEKNWKIIESFINTDNESIRKWYWNWEMITPKKQKQKINNYNYLWFEDNNAIEKTEQKT